MVTTESKTVPSKCFTRSLNEHVEAVVLHLDGAGQVQVLSDALEGVAVDELARRQDLAEVRPGRPKRLENFRELVELQERHLS